MGLSRVSDQELDEKKESSGLDDNEIQLNKERSEERKPTKV